MTAAAYGSRIGALWLAGPGRRGWVRIQFHSHSSSPGLTGRSSIPETAVLEPRSRGVLDPPHARGMTVSAWCLRCHFKHDSAFSRHGLPEVCPNVSPISPQQREQGMPGARCTRGLVCKVAQRDAHTSIQVQRRQSGIPCAMVLRLMPCSPRRRIHLVTVAAGLRLTRPGWIVLVTDSLTSATDARTTRFCRTRIASFVLRAVVHSRKTALRTHLRADAAASTASPPAFVTMANAPLAGKGWGELIVPSRPTG